MVLTHSSRHQSWCTEWTACETQADYMSALLPSKIAHKRPSHTNDRSTWDVGIHPAFNIPEAQSNLQWITKASLQHCVVTSTRCAASTNDCQRWSGSASTQSPATSKYTTFKRRPRLSRPMSGRASCRCCHRSTNDFTCSSGGSRIGNSSGGSSSSSVQLKVGARNVTSLGLAGQSCH